MLRGATVEVDARRIGRVLFALCAAALAVSSALLFAAGLAHNAGISRLRHSGVAVEVRVVGCRGLLGGSGSNPVGYSCWGRFVLDGHRYGEGIPGDALLAPGSTIAMLSVPGDPSLLAAPATVAGEHPSSKVFVLPGVLLATSVAMAGTALAQRRRRRPHAQPAERSPFRRAGGTRLGEVAGGV